MLLPIGRIQKKNRAMGEELVRDLAEQCCGEFNEAECVQEASVDM